MKQFVCNFAPLRFLPYRETGEFVNVGVVFHCPQTNFFAFQIVDKRKTSRVTKFFPELETTLFKTALTGMERELARVGLEFRTSDIELAPAMAKAWMAKFSEITRRREGLLHFGETGTLLTEAPERALVELFGRFVERQFAQKKEYQEIVMRNRLAHFLREWNLTRHYNVNQKIGDEDFHVVMPFVHYAGGVAEKAIKPLDLDKADTSDIYHHGGAWVKNMDRLVHRDQMPREVIFTVRLPVDGKRRAAAEEICDELRQFGVEPVQFGNTSQIYTLVSAGIAA